MLAKAQNKMSAKQAEELQRNRRSSRDLMQRDAEYNWCKAQAYNNMNDALKSLFLAPFFWPSLCKEHRIYRNCPLANHTPSQSQDRFL